MTEVTAIISLKVCPVCRARAPLGDVVPHEPSCSEDELCRLEMGPWPMAPGEQVVVVTPVELR